MPVSAVRGAGIALRVCVAFFLLVGIILIVFGCVLSNPPKGYAPGMFVAVGSLNLFASLAGFWGSYNKKRVLLVFIVFGGISLLLQIVFIITLLTAFDSVVSAVQKYSATTEAEKAQLARQLNVMRWVSLGFLFIELMTMILAALLKWVLKEDTQYHGFDDDANEARMLGLSNLRSDVESGRKNEKAYESIRQKMAMKYGAVAGAAGDWKKKVQISFGNGRS